MNKRSRKLFSWTVLTGLIFNLLSPLFLLPWQQVWACFGSWDCGGNAYCAGAGSYPDHPGSCADYGERGNNDRTTSEIARDYINSGGNPAEVVTRTSDFQGAASNNNAAAAAAAAQQLATAEAQRIAAEQAAAAKAAADAAAAKAADDKAKAEAQRLAQEAAERAARAAANAAAAAAAMTAINAAASSAIPATGTGAPAIAASTPTTAAAGANCGSGKHNACSPNSDGNWYRCNNGSWQKADDCKPAGAITCAAPACAGANGCVGDGVSGGQYAGTEKVCSNGSWIDKSTVPPVIPQDPNPEEAMETWLATGDERLADRRLPSPTAVNSPTARPIAVQPTSVPVAPTTTNRFEVCRPGISRNSDGTCADPTPRSTPTTVPTIPPNPTAIIGRPILPTLTPSAVSTFLPTAVIRRPVNPTLIPAPPTPVPTIVPTQAPNFFTPFDRAGERGGLAPTLTPVPAVKPLLPVTANDREDLASTTTGVEVCRPGIPRLPNGKCADETAAPTQSPGSSFILEEYACGERSGTWTNNTCQSPDQPTSTSIPLLPVTANDREDRMQQTSIPTPTLPYQLWTEPEFRPASPPYIEIPPTGEAGIAIVFDTYPVYFSDILLTHRPKDNLTILMDPVGFDLEDANRGVTTSFRSYEGYPSDQVFSTTVEPEKEYWLRVCDRSGLFNSCTDPIRVKGDDGITNLYHITMIGDEKILVQRFVTNDIDHMFSIGGVGSTQDSTGRVLIDAHDYMYLFSTGVRERWEVGVSGEDNLITPITAEEITFPTPTPTM